MFGIHYRQLLCNRRCNELIDASAVLLTFRGRQSTLIHPEYPQFTIDLRDPVDDLGRPETLLNGGPCRDRTSFQLIKSSFRARALFPVKTTTFAYPVVPPIADLGPIKFLNVLLIRFSNGTVCLGMALSLSNFEAPDRMCIKSI
jgi:hypothetical protein